MGHHFGSGLGPLVQHQSFTMPIDVTRRSNFPCLGVPLRNIGFGKSGSAEL